MRELVIPILELLAYLLLASTLTVLGALAELSSLSYFATGEYVFGAWLVVVGGIALYAGVVALGLGKVLPRLRTVLRRDATR